MKRIELTSATLEDGRLAATVELIKIVTMTAGNPQVGMTMDEARKGTPILNKVDPLNSDIRPSHALLEDSEHAFLVARIKAHTWPYYDRVLDGLLEAIIDAPDASVVEVEPEVQTHAEDLTTAGGC